ncbi:MAG: hypothetical protein HZB99_01490, partial [Candidatus Harrisonbacteria bacterium]|nr:hypothetical protein [Candidatus Harrisonbacteria bacterium]
TYYQSSEVEPPDIEVSSSGGSTSNLLSLIIDTVKNWLNSMQVTIENGLVKMKDLVVETLTGKKIKTDVLEIVDSATKETYCVRITNGEWDKTKGECAVGTTDNGQLTTDAETPTIEEQTPAEESASTELQSEGETAPEAPAATEE